MMRTNTIDIFTQKLFDYGSLQLFADTQKETARLQLLNGAYGLPISVVLDKDAAFDYYNNSSINTHHETLTQLIAMGGK